MRLAAFRLIFAVSLAMWGVFPFSHAQTPEAFRLTDNAGNIVTIDSTSSVVFGGSCTPAACSTGFVFVSPGQTVWSGQIGAFTVTTVIGLTKPALTPIPHMDVNLQSISTGAAGGTLKVEWTDIDFTETVASLRMAAGGILNGTGSVTFRTYYHVANVPFGTGTTIGTLGPFGPGPYGGSLTAAGVAGPVPFSLTEEITLNLGPNSALGGDFELVGEGPLGAIGDFVWMDNNQDGIQDPGEPGINGVTVRLKDGGGTLLATTVTATNGPADGYYQFPGLAAGTYVVEVDAASPPLAGKVASPSLVGPPAFDSNGSPAVVNLAAGESNQTIDFGYFTLCTGTIGDFVWHDLNRNGIQYPGEPGLANVTVNLRNAANVIVATTSTNGSGFYLFTGLCAGDYVVEVGPGVPAGFTPTISNAPGSTPATDSNGSPAPVTLPTNNSNDITIDFGYVSPCTGVIGDFVWHDLNHNGIQDPGEPGIDGVTVNLKNSLMVIIATTLTGPDGFYQFTGLCAGQYTVEVASGIPPGFTPTTSNAPGSTPANDSNGSPAPVTLPNDNSTDITIDFGYESPCTGVIGDFVWHDLDRDGIQDPGELGIGGVTVNLRNPLDNTLIATTSTNAAGLYSFMGLCAGDYKVDVVPPTGYAASPTGQGTAATDSNPNPSMVTLPTDASSDITIDFGFFQLAECAISEGAVEIKDRKLKWTLSNGATSPATLTGLTLTWPEANGKLKKVKFDGDVVWDAGAAWTSAGITLSAADFTTDPKKKRINPDKSRDFTLEFEKDAAAGPYQLNLTFDSSCEVDLDLPSNPGPQLAECKDLKPIEQIVLQYVGAKSLSSVSWYRTTVSDINNPGTTNLIGTASGATIGTSPFSFGNFAANSSTNNVDFVLTFTDSTKQLSQFHRSCSDPDMNDITDAGKLQGDGKSNSITGGNLWTLSDLQGKGLQMINFP